LRQALHPSYRPEIKATTHTLADGSPAHSFRTLLQDLSSIVRNSCKAGKGKDAPIFTVVTRPTDEQRRALNLLKKIA
jgi:hypothetical protein